MAGQKQSVADNSSINISRLNTAAYAHKSIATVFKVIQAHTYYSAYELLTSYPL